MHLTRYRRVRVLIASATALGLAAIGLAAGVKITGSAFSANAHDAPSRDYTVPVRSICSSIGRSSPLNARTCSTPRRAAIAPSRPSTV